MLNALIMLTQATWYSQSQNVNIHAWQRVGTYVMNYNGYGEYGFPRSPDIDQQWCDNGAAEAQQNSNDAVDDPQVYAQSRRAVQRQALSKRAQKQTVPLKTPKLALPTPRQKRGRRKKTVRREQTSKTCLHDGLHPQ